eukprot:4307620-Pleurochrysis_carterae.AAC.1
MCCSHNETATARDDLLLLSPPQLELSPREPSKSCARNVLYAIALGVLPVHSCYASISRLRCRVPARLASKIHSKECVVRHSSSSRDPSSAPQMNADKHTVHHYRQQLPFSNDMAVPENRMPRIRRIADPCLVTLVLSHTRRPAHWRALAAFQ